MSKYASHPPINLSESRRTLAAMLADVPHHELHGDAMTLEDFCNVAEGFLQRMVPRNASESDAADADWWGVRGLAVALLRVAGEALGRLQDRAFDAAERARQQQPRPSRSSRRDEHRRVF